MHIDDDLADTAFHIVGTDPTHGYETWLDAWHRCAAGDAFSHPDYLATLAAEGETPLAAVFDDRSGSHVLYAFLLREVTHDACGRPVTSECYDVAAPLLYGGPLLSLGHRADTAEVSDRFWRRFRHWALDKGVVTEFHRENPLADSSLGYPGDHIEQAPHAVKRLEGRTIDELLADASKSYRRTLRKAESSGIQVVVDESGERLEDFLRLHRETLDRNGADERFYLDRDYFAMLHREFAGSFAYIYALEDGRATSVEFILFCNDIAYALLGASDAQGLRSGANSYLVMQAFLYAQSRGVADYVLTGGVTNTEDDSLLRYKLSMAKSGRRRYRTAQQVIDPARYSELSCPHTTDSFFPVYRSAQHSCTHQGETESRTTEVSA